MVNKEEYLEDPSVPITDDDIRQESTSPTFAFTDVSKDPVLNQDVFKNRRKMAWVSLISMIGMIIFLFVFLIGVLLGFIFMPETMSNLTQNYQTYLDWSSSFIGWGIMAFTGIILAYMGVAAHFYSNYMKMKK